MRTAEGVTLTQVTLARARISTFRSSYVSAWMYVLLIVCNELANGHLSRPEELTIQVLNLLLAAGAIRFLVARHFLATAFRQKENRSWHYISLSNSN